MSQTKKKPPKGAARGSSKPRLNAILYAMLLEELIDGPSTWTELAEKTGLCRGSILAIIRAMRSRKLVYIAGWERDAGGRMNVPAFQLGRGKDAAKPVKTRAEVNRDQRLKMRMRRVADGLNARLAESLASHIAANDGARRAA